MGKPLDLGDSLLRSVSPVHLEYMANMGVRASMSVSLIVAGRLWGLISAGHREPHALPLALRSACETIGRTVSLQIGAFEALDFRRRQDDNVDALGRLVAGMQRATGDVLEGLANEPAALLEIAGAAGAAIVFDDRVARVGACPPESVVVDLARWIGERTLADGTFATHALSADDARWAPWAVDVSGVIAIALPSAAQRCVIWFRPEQAHPVNWGGNPDKAGSVDDAAGTPRMHPRRSFELWKEVVQGRSARWDPAELHAARTLRRYAVEVDLDRQIAKERAAVQARDELVAVLSHDLRTPMSVVVMQAAMIQRRVLDDPSQTMQRFRVAAATIQRAGGRMNALLNDLLDLSKIEAGRFSVAAGSYGARQLVAEACELMGTLATSSNIVLEQEATEDIVVKADPERIFQVFSNLIGNAIKYAAHSGQVRVGAARVRGMCEFQVSDDGDGIAPEHIDNIFERYWQGNPSDSAGAGLGLYIAKGIVEAHGGTLRARSRPGAGTTFAFTLPVDRSDPPS
ncbi:MAG: ATP-binding protein [Burkholderiaceae bacterium]